jgi:hypothetical protein
MVRCVSFNSLVTDHYRMYAASKEVTLVILTYGRGLHQFVKITNNVWPGRLALLIHSTPQASVGTG